MRIGWRTWAAAIAVGVTSSGCVRVPIHHYRLQESTSPWLESALPLTSRGTIEVIAPKQVPTSQGEAHRYYSLGPQEAQCMAATNSPLGSMFYGERGAIAAKDDPHHERSNALRQQALTAAAGEAQNASAGAALKLYYSIAEGEARADGLGRARAELDDVSKKIDQVRAQGLQIPFDASEFERRKIEVASQAQDLDLQLMRGNHELRRLIGLESRDPEVRIWPNVPLRADYAPVDVEAEVALGLATRPEIQILRLLSGSLDTETLDVARDFLKATSGLLGASSPVKCPAIVRCVLPHLIETEVQQRRSQINDRLARREREIAEQIREAARTFNANLEQVGLAQQRIESWDHRLSDLYKLQKTEGSTFADISVAKLNRLDAESKLIGAVAEVERSRAALREQTGELVAECSGMSGGYCPPVNSNFLPPPVPNVEYYEGIDPSETIKPGHVTEASNEVKAIEVSMPTEERSPLMAPRVAPPVIEGDATTQYVTQVGLKIVTAEPKPEPAELTSRRIQYDEAILR